MTRRDNRVPPHDHGAERALLGAALLSAEAARIVATVPAGDFHGAAHGHIAAAIGALHRRVDPVDAVTVSAELRHAGLHEAAGGDQVLIDLQIGVPSTGNAAGYAAIVRDHAAARRVMHELEEVLLLGYDGTPAVDLIGRALDRLGTALPTAGESTLAWADIEAILANGTAPVIDPDFLRRTDGQPLLYAGRVHVLQGEPSCGKSFIALLAAVELFQIGSTVLYIDLEDTDAGILGRLLALGATAQQLSHQFQLVRFHGPITELELADLQEHLDALNPDLVVIDGVAEALANDGLDENDNIAVVTWMNRVPKRIAETTQAAVILLDHVSKSKEDRGRWARGAGAKLGAVDGAAYELRVVEPFSRDHAGHVRLIIAKDRPGAIGPIGATAANAYVDPSGHGAVVRIRLEPPSDDEAEGKPTFIMGEISRWLAQQNGPVPDKEVKTAHSRLSQQGVVKALQELVLGGFIREMRDERRRKLYEPVRPYPPEKPPKNIPPNMPPPGVVDMDEWKRRNF